MGFIWLLIFGVVVFGSLSYFINGEIEIKMEMKDDWMYRSVYVVKLRDLRKLVVLVANGWEIYVELIFGDLSWAEIEMSMNLRVWCILNSLLIVWETAASCPWRCHQETPKIKAFWRCSAGYSFRVKWYFIKFSFYTLIKSALQLIIIKSTI